MFNYIKVAFTNRWNLLAMFAGVGIAAISGRPDIVAPLVLAGEATYLGLLSSHPKFQRYVDAQIHKSKQQGSIESKEAFLQRLTSSLPRDHVGRYETLRRRCIDLREIASNLQQTGHGHVTGSLDSLQLEGLDRLLWIFLRLLLTEHLLAQFLEKTDAAKIKKESEQIEKRLEQLEQRDASDHSMKLRRTLEDNLETCRQRLANYEKASGNHEFILLEIDRLENKIKSLAELAVNRREHDFISTQVDAVASSMADTEKTITELDFATGFEEPEGAIPELIRQPLPLTE